MGNLVHLHGDPHDQTLKLLPWYLNGTLDDAEAAMVEAHLAECAGCAREAERERALRTGVASLGADVDQGWAALRARLVEPAPPPRRALWGRRVAMGWAVGGALAASLVGAIAISALRPAAPTGAPYHVLGAPTVQGGSANALVMPAPGMTAARLGEALTRAGARITDGPLASGGYLVRIAPTGRTRALEQLRRQPDVLMAEPLEPADRP